MATLVTDAVNISFTGKEKWPENVNMFQPNEAAQILLPDFVACLSVKTFLRMCELKYTVDVRANAEHMSPSGRVPFIQAGNVIISEVEPIMEFAKNKGHCLSEHLTEEQKVLMKSFMALLDNKLLQAELYLTWNDKEMYNRVTEQRYGQPYPWPLNRLLPLRKKWDVQNYLKHSGWRNKSMEEVCGEVRKCCQALSEFLGEQPFFFGNNPTELDAVVYGHLYSLLTTPLPFKKFAEIVQEFENLIKFCKNTDTCYYGR